MDAGSRLRIGLVGAGGMGANHARVIAESGHAELAAVVDRDAGRREQLATRFGCRAGADLDAIRGCDAAVVAATTAAHEQLALALLDAGIPVLVEKPLAPDVAAAERIVARAAATGLPVMCGFVERFNPAVVTARALLDEPVIQLHSTRHSPRGAVATASVVQDLLIHDIDLALAVASDRGEPLVHGTTWAPEPGGRAEIAECLLTFADGMVANLSASRWGQRKIRDVRIVTEHLLVEVDLLRVNVTVYRNVSQAMVGDDGYRAETIVDVPYVRHRGEPLALQLAAFVALVQAGDADAIAAERNSVLPPHVVAAAME